MVEGVVRVIKQEFSLENIRATDWQSIQLLVGLVGLLTALSASSAVEASA